MEDKFVFISHSTQNKNIANAVCHILEEYGIPCWIAPRDILPGNTWAGNIVQAIRDCSLMVLIYSKESNISEQLANEVDKAFHYGKMIIPFMVDPTPMNDDFDYYLSRKHWLVAYPDYQEKLKPLVEAVAKNMCIEINCTGILSDTSEKVRPADEVVVEEIDETHKRISVNGIPMDFVLVESGEFIMGATPEQGADAYDDEYPSHHVRMTHDFHMAKYPVTNALWRTVMGEDVSSFDGDDAPAENMSWHECKEFISKLNKLTGLEFALPTEAQWEYAARGGKYNKGNKYAGSSEIAEVTWFEDNSRGTTLHVGQKSPNELGLYDMSGNVWEWCEDEYTSYTAETAENPVGISGGEHLKVLRGGSWCSCEGYCRVSARSYASADGRAINSGLRLILL